MTKKRKCIIHAVSTLAGGGAERVALEVAANCTFPGIETVILVASDEGPYAKKLPQGATLINVGIPLSVSNTLKFSSRLKCYFDEFEPVVVLSHLTEMSRMLLRCRCLGSLNTPILTVEHNNLSVGVSGRSWIKTALLKLELKILYSKAERIICVSQGCADSVNEVLGAHCKKRTEVIYNPVDRARIQKLQHDEPTGPFVETFKALKKPVILSVGRMHPQKGYFDLIRAFAELPTAERGSLVILGDGELRDSIVEEVESLGLCQDVHLPGFVDNPWWYMGQSDLFVLASHWEGFGLVLVEAMACGVPVVSTDCPYGPSEIIEHEKSGILVPVRDVASLKSTLQRCLEDEELLSSLHEPAMLRVDAFAPDVAYDKYTEMLNIYVSGGRNRE
jgi:glycosyltransferase involved in cell wall biosynthesis